MKTRYFLSENNLGVVRKHDLVNIEYWDWEKEEWVKTYDHFDIDCDCLYNRVTKKEAYHAIKNRTVPIYSI